MDIEVRSLEIFVDPECVENDSRGKETNKVKVKVKSQSSQQACSARGYGVA